MKYRVRINWYRAGLAASYALMETAYFGWNKFPGSPAEVLADGIAFVMFVLAFELVREE